MPSEAFVIVCQAYAVRLFSAGLAAVSEAIASIATTKRGWGGPSSWSRGKRTLSAATRRAQMVALIVGGLAAVVYVPASSATDGGAGAWRKT